MIDAHVHLWRRSRGDYGWLTPAAGPLWADFGPDDLKPLLDAAGVRAAVLVQAAPTVAETEWLLELADARPWIAGVVGWAALDAPDAGEAVARLAARRKLRGLRPMVQDLGDDRWLATAPLADGVAAMRATGLVFDALVKPRHLPALAEFLARFPELPVVLDHGGKPDIAGGGFAAWAAMVRELAAHPRLTCKLSGLATEAAPGWGVDDLRPCADVLIDAFGPGRLIWGSDWPVVTTAGDYAGWLSAARALTAGLTGDGSARVFGGNAARVYGLEAV